MSVSSKSAADKGSFGETVRVIIHALILALIVRTFLFQPFNIPSGSMEDTLEIGDFLFVSKYAYGYSHYSLPYSPDIFSGRIWSAPPKQGDIAVFKLPRDGKTDYIKRVIGLPGDRIQMIDGLLYINGEVVPREKVGETTVRVAQGRFIPAQIYRETLPNGVSYETLDFAQNQPNDNTEVFEVPPGNYFMMGDNRDNSLDSRVEAQRGGVGFVPLENFIGRAEIIFFSIEEGSRAWEIWKWPWTVRFNRLFKVL